MNIERYAAATHLLAVERFNAKLADARSEFRFYTQEPTSGQAISFETFVATDGPEVLGGYLLKHQAFSLAGEPIALANMQLPLSLGLIDKRFSYVSGAMLFDALDRNERIYCLGLGSQTSRLAQLLTAAGWQCLVVPFYFSIKNANRFARNIRLPAERAWTQRLLRAAGHLRLAGLGLWAANKRRRPVSPSRVVPVSVAQHFDQSADELFQQHLIAYTLVGDRSAAALNELCPPRDPKFIRLLVKDGDRLVGWALVLDTQMTDHKYFGSMRVGTLADCFAAPGDAGLVVAAADRFLSERGVDLVVSNQMHPAWGDALVNAGYRSGPSNFFFYFSPALADSLAATPGWERGIHLNRGDGDGPIHL